MKFYNNKFVAKQQYRVPCTALTIKNRLVYSVALLCLPIHIEYIIIEYVYNTESKLIFGHCVLNIDVYKSVLLPEKINEINTCINKN